LVNFILTCWKQKKDENIYLYKTSENSIKL
jgi:hypothetical protein